MAEEDFKIILNIEKFGFYFFPMLFGFVEVIFSIIYSASYIYLGLYFIAYGLLGYFVTSLRDRYSTKKLAEKPGYCFYVWGFIINCLLVAALFLAISKKYDVFIF